MAEQKATNVTWHEATVNKEARAAQKGTQKPAILWFTGLSGSGKSTVANALEKKLFSEGYHSYLLDGDNVRMGLNKNLGFTDEDRVENIRRIGEVAKLFIDSGLVVMTAFISPFQADRDTVRALVGEGEFVEVFIDTPLEICEERDPKGLYKKARSGEIPNFTGIDSPYEAPSNPEITVHTADLSVEECAEKLMADLRAGNFI